MIRLGHPACFSRHGRRGMGHCPQYCLDHHHHPETKILLVRRYHRGKQRRNNTLTRKTCTSSFSTLPGPGRIGDGNVAVGSSLPSVRVTHHRNSNTDKQTDPYSKVSSIPSETPSSSSSSTFDLERTKATELVDKLLNYTRQLMGPQEFPRHHLIAFSGGIDSSLVAALIQECITTGATNGANDGSGSSTLQQQIMKESATAVLGLSPAVPAEQVELAIKVADCIGIDLHQVPTKEGNDPTYLANEGRACYICKTNLYSTLSAIVREYNIDSNDLGNTGSTSIAKNVMQRNHSQQPPTHDASLPLYQLYNGTNSDDMKDATRVGLIAASEFNVQSPLANVSKQQIRLAARHMGLPNWNYAASPCLRSRLALGVPATPQHLQRIERAERFVRQTLLQQLQPQQSAAKHNGSYGWDNSTNLRVRLFSGNRICIEVDEDKLHAVERACSWQDSMLVHQLGFSPDIATRAFRTGSVARHNTSKNSSSAR